MGLLDDLLAGAIRQSTGINARRLVRRVGAGKLLLLGGAALAGALATEKLSRRGGVAGMFGGSTPTPAGSPSPSGAGVPPPPPGAPSPPAGAVPPPPPPAAAPDLPPPPPPPATPPLAADDAVDGIPPPPPPAAGAPAPAAPAARSDDAVEKTPPPPAAAGSGEELPPALLAAAVRTMVAAALADGRLSPEEKELIQRRLGDGGLPDDAVRQIHRDLVIPATPEELAALAPGPEERRALFRAAVLVLLADREASATERSWLARLGDALALPGAEQQALEGDLLSLLDRAEPPHA